MSARLFSTGVSVIVQHSLFICPQAFIPLWMMLLSSIRAPGSNKSSDNIALQRPLLWVIFHLMNACNSGNRHFCSTYYLFKQVCVHSFPPDFVLDMNIVHIPGCMYCAEHDKKTPKNKRESPQFLLLLNWSDCSLCLAATTYIWHVPTEMHDIGLKVLKEAVIILLPCRFHSRGAACPAHRIQNTHLPCLQIWNSYV